MCTHVATEANLTTPPGEADTRTTEADTPQEALCDTPPPY